MELRTQDGLYTDDAGEFDVECVLADLFRHDAACEPGCPDAHLLDRYMTLAADRTHFVQATLHPDLSGLVLEYRDGGEPGAFVVHRLVDPVPEREARRLMDDYLAGKPDWHAGRRWEAA